MSLGSSPTVVVDDPDLTLLHGDALDVLRGLPSGSVHCALTSPPYWGLRDYGTDGQIGLEATPEAYVASLVEVFREVRRVLRSDGTLWLNLGDSYASGGGAGTQGENGQMASRSVSDARITRPRGGLQGGTATIDVSLGGGRGPGLKPKDLVGIPWRVAFALQQPYYTGRIKDERDRIWLAAMLDAEGCIHIHRRKGNDILDAPGSIA